MTCTPLLQLLAPRNLVVHPLNAIEKHEVRLFERGRNDGWCEFAVLVFEVRQQRCSERCSWTYQFLFHVRSLWCWLCRNFHRSPGQGGHPFHAKRRGDPPWLTRTALAAPFLSLCSG